MQSTGHTSTQAESFVPMQGSQMMYANYPSRYLSISRNVPGLLRRLLYRDAPGKAVRITVVMRDGGLGVTPAVVPFSVVEIDQPEALGLCPERLELFGPAVDDVPNGSRQSGMGRVVFGPAVQLRGQ